MKKVEEQVWLVRCGIKQVFAGEKHHQSNLTPGNLRHLPLRSQWKLVSKC